MNLQRLVAVARQCVRISIAKREHSAQAIAPLDGVTGRCNRKLREFGRHHAIARCMSRMNALDIAAIGLNGKLHRASRLRERMAPGAHDDLGAQVACMQAIERRRAGGRAERAKHRGGMEPPF